MKRPIILLFGLILSGLYVVPSVVVEKIKIGEIELDFSNLHIARAAFGIGLIVCTLLAGLSYAEELIDTDARPGVEQAAIGWSAHPDRLTAGQVMARHRIAFVKRFILDWLPSGIILVVTIFFLWQVFTGRIHDDPTTPERNAISHLDQS